MRFDLYTDPEKKQVLDKILGSDLFKTKDVYQKLLTYIVDADLKGDVPTEISISQDIFNKGEEFVSAEDTTVRVYMHNLRKKLDQYYLEEGKQDQIRLLIPKGHYRVLFEKNTAESDEKEKIGKNRNILILSFILLLAVIYILFDKFYLDPQQSERTNPYQNKLIWTNFFDNAFPNAVLVGDFLVFHEYNAALGRARRIQDYSINTEAELKLYSDKNKELEVEKWTLGELPHNIVFNLIDLNRVFYAFELPVRIHFSSEESIDFIKNKNVIYIGEFKNLRLLADIISFLPIKYQTMPWWQGSLTFLDADSTRTLNTFHDWGVSRYVVDLGMVVKLPGQNKENYLIIAGFGYDSQIKLVEMLSDPSDLKEIEDKILDKFDHVPDYFAMVFEITGFDRASSNAEMKFFYEVKEDYYKQYIQATGGIK